MPARTPPGSMVRFPGRTCGCPTGNADIHVGPQRESGLPECQVVGGRHLIVTASLEDEHRPIEVAAVATGRNCAGRASSEPVSRRGGRRRASTRQVRAVDASRSLAHLLDGWRRSGGCRWIERGEIAQLSDGAPVHGFAPACEKDEPGDGRFARRDSWGDRAAQAVTEEEDAPRIDRRVLPEKFDGRNCRGHVLVNNREVRHLLDLGGMAVGHLVEAQDGNAARGEAPSEILEWFVPADRLIPVDRSGAGEQHECR